MLTKARYDDACNVLVKEKTSSTGQAFKGQVPIESDSKGEIWWPLQCPRKGEDETLLGMHSNDHRFQ